MSDKVRFTLTIGKGLYDEISQLAKERQTSKNTIVLNALMYYQLRDNHLDITQYKIKELIRTLYQ